MFLMHAKSFVAMLPPQKNGFDGRTGKRGIFSAFEFCCVFNIRLMNASVKLDELQRQQFGKTSLKEKYETNLYFAGIQFHEQREGFFY